MCKQGQVIVCQPENPNPAVRTNMVVCPRPAVTRTVEMELGVEILLFVLHLKKGHLRRLVVCTSLVKVVFKILRTGDHSERKLMINIPFRTKSDVTV